LFGPEFLLFQRFLFSTILICLSQDHSLVIFMNSKIFFSRFSCSPLLRIPIDFGHLFRFNSATHSESNRPPIPMISAGGWRRWITWVMIGLQKGVQNGPRKVIHAKDIGSAPAELGAEVVGSKDRT
jgi:hypothetical protein